MGARQGVPMEPPAPAGAESAKRWLTSRACSASGGWKSAAAAEVAAASDRTASVAARQTIVCMVGSLHLVGVLAGDAGVHVGEGAARVGPPGPDVQLVERVEAVAVGRAVEVEQLALERG